MNFYRTSVFFFSVLFFASTSSVAQNDRGQGMFVMCRLGKIVRTIRVVLQPTDRCETLYTKGGRDRSVGKAYNKKSCESFLNNVRSNLEKASWKCKELEGVTVSSIPESLSEKTPAG